MDDFLDRRTFILGSAALSTLAAFGIPQSAFAAEGDLTFGEPKPFSFDQLVERAKTMATQAYVPPVKPAADITSRLDYSQLSHIKYKPEDALWANGPQPFEVTFFHLGTFFQKRVNMYVLDGQQAREIIYKRALFDIPADSPAQQLPDDIGFAGFRVQEAKAGSLDWKKNDWVAFLGASYFRTIGELFQYGLSARGIAINPANPNPPYDEEFPDFTDFWIEAVPNSSNQVRVYALLDGASIAGAFSFLFTRGKAVISDVDARLFLRNDVARFGIAPLTSMFWYSETVKQTALDWRPEVHDSDGLAMWTGSGEHIWRPLNNPPSLRVSAFSDNNPRGFGLSQRDRNFDHYLDGVKYDLRPSAWVEPLEPFGEGAIQLIEINTDDEIHDNIVAMWVPKEPVKAGQNFNLKYRITWGADEPSPSPLGRCVATRLGNGGEPGRPRPKGVRKFVIEFVGGPLKDIPFGVKPEAVLSTSRGEFSYIFTEAVPNDKPGHWRVQFDLTVTGPEAVELRCYMKNGEQVLTETWLYQYIPF